MTDGWIRLYRELQHNRIWKEKPYTRGQAWVDMLLRCNHVCVQMPPQYQSIWVLRGQFLSSNIKLGEAWGWGECKVRRFMEYLVNEGMVRYFSRNKYTVYEITKFAELQSSEIELYEAACDEQKTNRKRTENEQKTTNNNDNNDKKLKDICTTPRFIPPSTDEVKAYVKKSINIFVPDSPELRFAEKLKAYILKNNPSAKVPDDLQKWAKEFDYMLRLDKRTPEQIDAVMEFSQTDSFWMTNILSSGKMRKQFDQLTLKMKKPKQAGTGVPQKGNFEQRKYSNEEIDKLYK